MGERGVVLRREGLYSFHLTERRKARDAGALAGLAATRGRPPADPVERDNERLRAVNARFEADLGTARRVIEVQGEVSALLEDVSGRAHDASEAPTPSRSAEFTAAAEQVTDQAVLDLTPLIGATDVLRPASKNT